MKRIALIVIVVAFVVWIGGVVVPNVKEKREAQKNMQSVPEAPDDQVGNPERGDGDPGGPGGPGGGPGGGPRMNPFEQLKDEEGNMVLAKLDELDMPDQFKDGIRENLTAADKNADGLVDAEEQKELETIRRDQSIARRVDQIKNDAGEYELAKLEDARMPGEYKDVLREADADGDGLLNADELQAAKEKIAELPPPSFGGRGGGPGGSGGPGGPGGPGRGPGGPGREPSGYGGPDASEGARVPAM